jgi:hypothetical protein
MTSKAVSVLKIVKGLEDYIKYLMNTSDDISSSIQAVADDMDRDNDAEDSLRRDLEKLSLSEGVIKERYDVDYFTVSHNGKKFDNFRFNSRAKAQRFIDRAMNDDKEYEMEVYKRYVELYKDNPEDMKYEPLKAVTYTIGSDSESYTM